jgi:hypothetical protein
VCETKRHITNILESVYIYKLPDWRNSHAGVARADVYEKGTLKILRWRVSREEKRTFRDSTGPRLL